MKYLISLINIFAGWLYTWSARYARHPNHPYKALGRMLPDHTVEFAFESGGRKYYRFTNAQDIPCGRSMAALQCYGELELRVTKEHLIAYLHLVEAYIDKDAAVKTSDVVEHTKAMYKRLTWLNEPQIIYKIAACVFFDESESPYEIDLAYHEKKIARWHSEPIEHFFLSMPPTQLLGLTPDLSKVSGSYLKERVGETLSQLRSIRRLANANMPSDLRQRLDSLEGQLVKLSA